MGGVRIGGGNFQIIAGPCSVGEQGADRGGGKARAGCRRGAASGRRLQARAPSPYAFQGLHKEGIDLLLEAKAATGLPIVTELMDAANIPLFKDVGRDPGGRPQHADFELLKELGQLRKPILLKRGLANTIQELLMSAEYIMAGGNEQVILCERGIRTFETATRNTLDISAVPVLKHLTHLPVVVDPSHATGISRFVEPLALASAACGADGLMIEVHNDPEHAMSDGPQSLTPEAFERLVPKVRTVRAAVVGAGA